MDDLGEIPLFSETLISSYIYHAPVLATFLEVPGMIGQQFSERLHFQEKLGVSPLSPPLFPCQVTDRPLGASR